MGREGLNWTKKLLPYKVASLKNTYIASRPVSRVFFFLKKNQLLIQTYQITQGSSKCINMKLYVFYENYFHPLTCEKRVIEYRGCLGKCWFENISEIFPNFEYSRKITFFYWSCRLHELNVTKKSSIQCYFSRNSEKTYRSVYSKIFSAVAFWIPLDGCFHVLKCQLLAIFVNVQ